MVLLHTGDSSGDRGLCTGTDRTEKGKGREGKRREEKGREGKGREGEGRGGMGRENGRVRDWPKK